MFLKYHNCQPQLQNLCRYHCCLMLPSVCICLPLTCAMSTSALVRWWYLTCSVHLSSPAARCKQLLHHYWQGSSPQCLLPWPSPPLLCSTHLPGHGSGCTADCGKQHTPGTNRCRQEAYTPHQHDLQLCNMLLCQHASIQDRNGSITVATTLNAIHTAADAICLKMPNILSCCPCSASLFTH